MNEARDALQKRISEGEPLFPHEVAAIFMALEREHSEEAVGWGFRLAKLEARKMRLWPDNDSSFYALFWVCVALVSVVGIIAGLLSSVLA